jgi:hypothetical protein
MLGRRALAVLVALTAAGCGGVRAASTCSLALEAAGGRIKVTFSGTEGHVVVVQEGHVKWRGDGKRLFWLNDYRGADTVMVRVTTPDGRVCSARRTLREKN